jgi:hypothetical protein
VTEREPEIFELFEKHGHYSIVRSSKTNKFHVAWYDSDLRRVRRRKLNTTSSALATSIVERLIRDGVEGDPKDSLITKPMTFVFEALDYYSKHHASGIRSGDAANTAIAKYLKPAFGKTRINSLRKRDVLSWSKKLQAQGLSLGYVSRILSCLRAALNLAVDDDEITSAPKIPEIRGDKEIEAEPLRGRVLTLKETAAFFDAINELHFLNYSIAKVNSGGARPEAILEATLDGVDWEAGLFTLNPEGRVQTKKYRPIVRVTATWEPWLQLISVGPIVTYDGKPVKSTKTAMRATVKRAKLKGRVNSTSLRHTLGRWLETKKVPDFERSILLGHVATSKKKTTRRYSPTDPGHPEYLQHAARAIEEFVREVNKLTLKWDLEQPGVIKNGWKKP